MKWKNIREISHDKCVGCTACANICPKNCIEMKMDLEGFLYPEIDMEKCVRCGRCYRVCPTIQVKKQEFYPKVLGMINRSKKIREKSSSGGVFYSLALSILEAGGAVCGAMLDDYMDVKHVIIHDKKKIDGLAKSKYVQSDLGNCYLQIQKMLECGKKVLFVGTPCQVYGLHTFLNKEHEDLFLVDLVCHGVPSPQIWREFVEDMEKQRNARCKSISFRDKSLEGWGNFGMKIEFSDHSEYVDTQKQNPYMFGFLRGYIDRRCCYNCQFRGMNRCSDLTMGDFWTVDDYIVQFNDNKGTSLLYVNTKKGMELVRTIRSNFYIKKVPEEKWQELNSAYEKSSLEMKNREKFYKKYLGGKKRVIDLLNIEMRKYGNCR
ncbi:MAG: 4Fe-4S dicluster domain-containing protein [Lachnospiraceae bacterium]|jgi:coenzyme F420-reducing hydrogenase beta subunit|nr:4Fe-4S dicluster domain-containing protein [Lachnospiraceae bacterium]